MLAGSCEFQSAVDVRAALEQEVRHVEVAVDDGKGERHVEHLLRRGRVPVEVAARIRVVVGILIVEGARRRRRCRTSRFTRARSPMPAAYGRSSGTGQIRVSNGSRCVFAYMNAHSMALDGGGGWRRRSAGRGRAGRR